MLLVFGVMGTVGGDDVGGVVIDCGSWMTRGGMAGDDAPKVSIPSVVGWGGGGGGKEKELDGGEDGGGLVNGGGGGVGAVVTKRERKVWVGDEVVGAALAVEDVGEVFKLKGDGSRVVEDWDGMERIWRTVVRSYLNVEAKDSPLLLVEGAQTWGPDGRAAAAERVFEGLGMKGCFVARGAVMAAFATARSTALVVDVGAQGAFAVPVVEGYALDKPRQWSALGGRVLSEYLATIVTAKAGDRGIRAAHEIRKKRRSDGSFEVTPITPRPHWTKAHDVFYRMRVVDDLKHSVCAILEMPPENATASGTTPAGNTNENGNNHGDNILMDTTPSRPQARENTAYELPDGQIVDIGAAVAEKIPESLFDPTLLLGDVTSPGIKSARSLHKLAFDAASACDIDVRRELYGALVLTGGSTLFPGLPERFQRELAAITPQMFKLRLTIPPHRQERTSAPWFGGSILSSLGTFQQMWMSKQEYDEHGAMAINRKCS